MRKGRDTWGRGGCLFSGRLPALSGHTARKPPGRLFAPQEQRARSGPSGGVPAEALHPHARTPLRGSGRAPGLRGLADALPASRPPRRPPGTAAGWQGHAERASARGVCCGSSGWARRGLRARAPRRKGGSAALSARRSGVLWSKEGQRGCSGAADPKSRPRALRGCGGAGEPACALPLCDR